MNKFVFYLAPLLIIGLLFSCKTTEPQAKEFAVPFMWSSETVEEPSWSVNVPATQEYIVTIKVKNSTDSEKTLSFTTDQGHNVGFTVPNTSKTETFWFEGLLMKTGTTMLNIEDLNEGIEVVSISLGHTLLVDSRPLDVVPINPNATQEVKDLMNFLGKNYGKHILSGQMDLTWDDSVNMELRVAKFTKQKPAIMGFDFMNYKGSADSGSGLKQVEEAIAYANRGGIITFCWHWRMGSNNEFYSKKTDFRIDQDINSEAYKAIITDIDQIALELKKLSDNNIPVLWRPLHEASGGWFWWGASTPEDYLFLWDLMYDRMTNYHKLNNLIWVWNGEDKDWYPGDDKLDIIGVDIYKGRGNHSSQVVMFAEAQSYINGDENKLIAITENGSIPDPAYLENEMVPWSWFMTWNDNNSNSPDDFFSGDLFTSHKKKYEFYNNPYVLNLEDLSK